MTDTKIGYRQLAEQIDEILERIDASPATDVWTVQAQARLCSVLAGALILLRNLAVREEQ